LSIKQTFTGSKKKRRNSRNNTNRWEDVITKDIESFLGIIILMGINSLPSMKHYWSKDNVFHNSFISSIMSRNRFLQIFYNLHLADNSLEPKSGSTNYSKIYKIKHFVEILLRNFQNNYKFGHYGSIDETMVKFKGRSSLKQYIPLKTKKEAIKFGAYATRSPVTYSIVEFTSEKKELVITNHFWANVSFSPLLLIIIWRENTCISTTSLLLFLY